MAGRFQPARWFGLRATPAIPWLQVCRFPIAPAACWSTTIWKWKTLQGSGRWETAHWYPIHGPKVFIPLPRNTHCAKAALLPAILRRKSWALQRGPSATPLWASWLRSDAELAWPTSWECSFPGLLPGGRFWLQVGFRSWELPTMSTQPGADGIEQVAFGFMAS